MKTLVSRFKKKNQCLTIKKRDFTKKTGASQWKHRLYVFCQGRVLYLDFNLNTAGKLKLHQGVDSLRGRVVDVDQTLEVGELELLTCLLVDERTAVYSVDALVGGEGDRTAHHGTGSFDGLDDFLSRLVDQFVVVALQFDSDFRTHVFINF